MKKVRIVCILCAILLALSACALGEGMITIPQLQEKLGDTTQLLSKFGMMQFAYTNYNEQGGASQTTTYSASLKDGAFTMLRTMQAVNETQRVDEYYTSDFESYGVLQDNGENPTSEYYVSIFPFAELDPPIVTMADYNLSAFSFSPNEVVSSDVSENGVRTITTQLTLDDTLREQLKYRTDLDDCTGLTCWYMFSLEDDRPLACLAYMSADNEERLLSDVAFTYLDEMPEIPATVAELQAMPRERTVTVHCGDTVMEHKFPKGVHVFPRGCEGYQYFMDAEGKALYEYNDDLSTDIEVYFLKMGE